jgi:hypothetical protein
VFGVILLVVAHDPGLAAILFVVGVSSWRCIPYLIGSLRVNALNDAHRRATAIVGKRVQFVDDLRQAIKRYTTFANFTPHAGSNSGFKCLEKFL